MEIYLIRHTRPDIAKGTCYGQADIGTVHTFLEEAACIERHLPPNIRRVYSSPLRRCRQLAEYLFPQHSIRFDDRLKEINCGEWELRLWDEIEPEPLQRWMSDLVNVCIPGGESYVHLYERVTSFFRSIKEAEGPVAIVAHGGVLRSLLAFIEGISLEESFRAFSLRYGCVVRLSWSGERFCHQVLHNPVTEMEQHRPTRFRQAG